MFKEKTLNELQQLEDQVNDTMSNHDFKIDFDYWVLIILNTGICIAKIGGS